MNIEDYLKDWEVSGLPGRFKYGWCDNKKTVTKFVSTGHSATPFVCLSCRKTDENHIWLSSDDIVKIISDYVTLGGKVFERNEVMPNV